MSQPYFRFHLEEDHLDHIKDDRELVVASVAHYPRKLEFASTRLQRDRDVVALAVSEDASCLDFVASELQRDKELLQRAMESRGRVSLYLSLAPELQVDVMGALRRHMSACDASELFRRRFESVPLPVVMTGQSSRTVYVDWQVYLECS